MMHSHYSKPLRIDQERTLNGADTEPSEIRALVLDLRHDRTTLGKEDTATVANLLEDAFARLVDLTDQRKLVDDELEKVKEELAEVNYRMDSLEK